MKEALKLLQQAVEADKHLHSTIETLNQQKETVEKSIVIDNIQINDDCKRLLRKMLRRFPIELKNISRNANDYWPEEIFILNINGFLVRKNKIWLKRELVSEQFDANQKLKDAGYQICGPDDFEPETKIRSGNIFFYSASDLIFWILQDNSTRTAITITEGLINKLNNEFNAGIKNVRAFIATLERYEKLIKIESHDFTIALDNEKLIAKEMWEKIDGLQFNFLTKQLISTVCIEWITKYGLQLDEPYYILVRNPKKTGKKYYFTSGNSMCISSSRTLVNLTIEERMKKVFNHPVCLPRTSMSLSVGTNDFSTVNIKTLFYTGDNFLYYDVKNENHKKYVIAKFKPFIENLKKASFSISDLKTYCEISDDEFLIGLKDHYSFGFALKLFEDKIKQNKSSKIYYLVNSSNDNSKKYIDINDWSDF